MVSNVIPTVVYGPMACGKTRNAEALRRLTGCDSIVDGWYHGRPLPQGNVLILTIMDLGEIVRAAKGRPFFARSFSAFGLEGARRAREGGNADG